MKNGVGLACLLIACAGPVQAQFPPMPALGRDWMAIAYPKLFYAGREGMTFGFFTGQVLPHTFDDFFAPPPYRAALLLDGQLSTSGSKHLRLDARLPRAVDGWRFVLSLAGLRSAREPYFGLGNASIYDRANETDAQPHFYRSDRVRLFARGEVQRRLVGPLRVVAGFHAERWKLDTLPGPSQLARDALTGAVTGVGRYASDVSTRIGLVLDTRNDEPAPTRGVLLQAIYGVADSSVLGDLSYTRLTISAAGFLPVTERLTLAARVLGQSIGGSPGVGTLYLIEASDEPFRGIGGDRSHRALRTNRLLGADKLLANFDVRYTVFEQPTAARVTLLAFLDAGRVFPGDDFQVTTDGLHVGGGGGFFLQVLRNAILGTTIGTGPDGVVVKLHTEWSY